MKGLILIILTCLTLMACTHGASKKLDDENQETEVEQTVSQGEALLNMLNANNQSLLVLNNDSLSFYNGRGVSDLLQLLSEDADCLNGAIVADKMVGKAAATLMVAAKVREVHTNLICTPAIEVFQAAGIPVFFTEEVPQILNKDRSGQCPIDALLNEAESVEECVAILNKKIKIK